MDTKNLSLLFKTSLLAATMSMVVGCSENPIPTSTPTTDSVNAEIDSSIENAANNGTVITVADGYGRDCTVTSGDVEAVEVDRDNAPGSYLFLTRPTLPIFAIECIDFHTGSIMPPLSRPAPRPRIELEPLEPFDFPSFNLTPVTTVQQGYIESGLDEAAAANRTREFLGLPENSDLERDPVAASEEGGTDNDSFVKAALKVTAIAKTLEKTGQTDPIKAIAAATKTNTTTNTTLDDAIGDDEVINKVVTDVAQRANAKTIAASVKAAIDTNTVNQTAAGVIDNIAKIIKTISDQNTALATLLNASTLASTSASRTDLNAAGKVTKKITKNSAEFTTVVTKIKTEAKKDPDNANFLPATLKETVQAKVTELKTISGATAGN